MSIYDAKTPEVLREGVLRLCMASIEESRYNSGLPMAVCAERIVPRVPVAEPVLREVIGASGERYRYVGNRFVWRWENAEGSEEMEWRECFDVRVEDIETLLDLKAHPTVAEEVITLTPQGAATVAGEPFCWANIYTVGGSAIHYSESVARNHAQGKLAIETAVPLYRHPATPADAIALLVREGWVERLQEFPRELEMKSVRVLIAPEGAAHE